MMVRARGAPHKEIYTRKGQAMSEAKTPQIRRRGDARPTTVHPETAVVIVKVTPPVTRCRQPRAVLASVTARYMALRSWSKWREAVHHCFSDDATCRCLSTACMVACPYYASAQEEVEKVDRIRNVPCQRVSIFLGNSYPTKLAPYQKHTPCYMSTSGRLK